MARDRRPPAGPQRGGVSKSVASWSRAFDSDSDYDETPEFKAAYAAADTIAAHVTAELLADPEWLARYAAKKARHAAADLLEAAAAAREEG
jgi:hypothetical protein